MERRKHTIKKNVRLTEQGIADIQAWATTHGLSFSAALETLSKLGMDKDLNEALLPAVLSLTRRTIQGEYARLVRLVVYGIVESGYAARMSSAAVRQLVKDTDLFLTIRSSARTDARKNMSRGKIRDVMGEIAHDYETHEHR